jgi:AraC-like DNA-binding protein
MTLDELKAHLEATTPALCRAVGYVPSELPRLSFVRHSSVTPLEATVYEPVLCLILRGRKRTLAGTLSVDFGPGESLIVSHVVPVVSAITEAPYLALLLSLDVGLLRSLGDETGQVASPRRAASAIEVGRADAPLLDALGRYASLALKPDESRFLGPLVLKEIHFRLFRAAHGGMLRELLAPDSDASRIHRAVQLIRQDYRTGISVSDLARTSGMSESVFFRKFKDITGNTPLGFLKAMRLLEARRLLSADAHNVTEAALEVGYTSPSQFSREYSRAFGVTPSTHAQGR